VTVDSMILLLFLPIINRLTPIDESGLNFAIDPQDPHAGTHLLVIELR